MISRDTSYKYGKVINHSPSLMMKNVKPVVHQSGLERYKETGVKSVHAFLRGILIGLNVERPMDGRSIIYDENGSFLYKDTMIKYEGIKFVKFNDSVVVKG